jgi:hypothetical protein
MYEHIRKDGKQCRGARPGILPQKGMVLGCPICLEEVQPRAVAPQGPPKAIAASFGQVNAMMAQRQAEAEYSVATASPEAVSMCAGDASRLPNRVAEPFAAAAAQSAAAVKADITSAMQMLERGRGNRQTTAVDVVAASIRRAQMENEARIADQAAAAQLTAAAAAKIVASPNTLAELPTAAS